MYFAITTLFALHTGWILGLPLDTWLLLWLLSGGAGRFLDLIFTTSFAQCPSQPQETIYAKRTTRICLARSTVPAH